MKEKFTIVLMKDSIVLLREGGCNRLTCYGVRDVAISYLLTYMNAATVN